ncbi:MAG: sugar-binding protein [Myxococcota bacterium]
MPNGGQYPDTAPGFGRAHAFYISTSDNIFDGNRVYHAGQYGFHIFNSKRIEFPFHRNIVRNNLIYDNAQGTTRYGHRSGAGIILSGGSGSIAYNNVIWGHTVGISVGYGAVDVTVVHNTLYNNTVGISVGNEWSPTTDTYVANNLLVSNVVGVNISGIVSGTTIERNLLYLSPGILDAGESTQQRDNLLDIDPQLVNTNAHDFTPLSKNSPVVDAAIHLSSAGLEFDHNHQPRPQGNGPDIGAIEFQESTQTPPPPPPSILEYTIMRASAPPVIDGDPREFTGATEIVLAQKTTNTEATYWLLWDDDALYVAAHVVDESLEAVGTESIDPLWSDDSLELFLDTQHNRGSRLDADDFKFFVTATNVQSTHPLDAVAFLSAVTTGGEINSSADKDQGYWLEMRVRWQDMGVAAPTAGGTWGFDIVNNDRADGERSIAAWASDPESGLNNPDGWGTLRFSNATIDLCHSPTAEICNDGIDNDCDGAVDGADTTCNISGTCADETACIDDDMCCPAGCAGSDSDCPVTGNADVLCTDNAAGSKDCTSVVTTQGCSGATGSSVTLFCLALGLLKRRRRRV